MYEGVKNLSYSYNGIFVANLVLCSSDQPFYIYNIHWVLEPIVYLKLLGDILDNKLVTIRCNYDGQVHSGYNVIIYINIDKNVAKVRFYCLK